MLLLSLLIYIHVKLYCVEGGRWLLLGGYTGFESQDGSGPTDGLDLLALGQETQYGDPSKWCSRSLSSLPLGLEGSAVSWVDTRKFLSNHLGDSSFTTAHHTTHFDGALLCGGADRQCCIVLHSAAKCCRELHCAL